jgi:transposase
VTAESVTVVVMGEAVPVDVRLLAAITGSLDGVNVSALCRDLEVSTKTFYKWRARFAAEGSKASSPVRGARSRPRTRPVR